MPDSSNTSNTTLPELIGSKVLAVAAHYRSAKDAHSETRVYVCGAMLRCDNTLSLLLPRGHQLKVGESFTFHLDNRTGVSEYDEQLSLHRLSYKGRVITHSECAAEIDPVEFQVFYGLRIVLEYKEAGYQYPNDYRDDVPPPESPLEVPPIIDQSEHNNKVGVMIIQAIAKPYTRVIAFLSSEDDDIFMTIFPETFKSKVLKRNNLCHVAIDDRASLTFEEAIEWNYSIIEAEAFAIDRKRDLFSTIQQLFILKNPWEAGFFSREDVEMFHLKPKSVVCPTKAPGQL